MALVAVTGPTGQLGRQVVSMLSARGDTVIAVSGSSPDHQMPVHKWISWPYDTRRLPPWDVEVDAVIHLSAQTSAYEARRDPVRDVGQNVLRFVALLESLRGQERAPAVVLSGAVTELGSSSTLIDHRSPSDPSTFYDVGKVAQSLYLRQFTNEGWVSGVHLRFSNVYGGRGVKRSRHRGFINRSIDNALAGKPLSLYRGINGRRDLLHVSDAARALISSIDMPVTSEPLEYVVGSGTSLTLFEVLTRIADCVAMTTGRRVEVNVVDPPDQLYEIEGRDVVIDSSRFCLDASWQPRISLDEGLALYVAAAYAG